MDIKFNYVPKPNQPKATFKDTPARLLCEIKPDPHLLSQFIERNPVHRGTDTSVCLSLHEVNSEVVSVKHKAVNHTEGGWPKDINSDEADQTSRFRKKIEKDEIYQNYFNSMTASIEHYVKQNNCLNIYENYFQSEENGAMADEPSRVETIGTFKFQGTGCESPPGAAVQIQWMPENPNKFVVAHCYINYLNNHLNNNSGCCPIWDMNNSMTADSTLYSPHAVCSIQFNPRDVNILAGGLYSGQLAFWDIRKSNHVCDTTPLEVSHHGPAWKVLWIQSKSGTEFFSTSIDGQVMWWDTRKLTEPAETLYLDLSRKQELNSAQGSFVLEYEPSIPTKFMAATESGYILQCNRKGKTPGEKIANSYFGHVGTVYALQRNPVFNKCFLSVGDWSVRVWSEDHRESYIIGSDYEDRLLTDGMWSPTRPAVFFVTKRDGTFDVWDLMFRQFEPVLSARICDDSLESLTVSSSGEFIALGSSAAVVTLLQLSQGFWQQTKSEKTAIGNLFERETNREKILEARNREVMMKNKVQEGLKQTDQKDDVATDHPPTEAESKQEEMDPVESAEKEFFEYIESQRNARNIRNVTNEEQEKLKAQEEQH